MIVSELKTGQFAEVNGSIIYRYKPEGDPKGFSWEGIFILEYHPQKSIWFTNLLCAVIIKPEKKHVDNAIKMLHEALKNSTKDFTNIIVDVRNTHLVDNLTYIENITILKNYLKPDIIEEDKN